MLNRGKFLELYKYQIWERENYSIFTDASGHIQLPHDMVTTLQADLDLVTNNIAPATPKKSIIKKNETNKKTETFKSLLLVNNQANSDQGTSLLR